MKDREPAAQAPRQPGLRSNPWAFVATHVRRRPWSFASLALIIALGSTCAVGVQYGMKLIVDEMAGGDRAGMEVWRYVGLFVFLIAAENGLWRVGGWHGSRIIIATGVEVRVDLFQRLAGSSMNSFHDRLSGALGGRVSAAAGAMSTLLGDFAWHVLPPCVDFIGAVVVLGSIDPRMAVALVVFAMLVFGLVAAFGVRGKALHKMLAERQAAATGELVDIVANIWTVKAFGLQSRERERFSAAMAQEAEAHRRSWMHTEKARVLHDVLLWLLAGGMLGWAIEGWRTGIRTPGDVVVVSALTFRILHGSRDLALAWVGAMQQFGVVDDVVTVISSMPTIAEQPGAAPLKVSGGTVRLEGVGYGYPDRPLLFKSLDLEIPAGQRLGIVGVSGGGKSTLVSLIQRHDDVAEGRITIDGQDVRLVTHQSLQQAIAVVPQAVGLFHRTIRENIACGAPGATSVQVRAAARDARCMFIEELPEGFDSLVGERGARLSGGQRQRLGIARAFLHDGPILILDEATAALDSETEREIQSALEGKMAGRTVIAVAHRLSTVAGFDRIIVMGDGTILEDGSPGALLAAGGVYRELWDMQQRGLSVD